MPITTSTTITIPDLGPVLFTKSSRAKRLSITIKPDQTIRVAVPTRTSFKTAQDFMLTKLTWARKHLARLRAVETDYAQKTLPPINRTKAKTILTIRLKYLAQKYGFKFNRVFIRNQKTRWGSCSTKNNISLNMNLAGLPQELQDYVILHELMHTKFKNHSKKFWAEMDKLVGDSKKLRKRMKEYRLGV